MLSQAFVFKDHPALSVFEKIDKHFTLEQKSRLLLLMKK